MTTSYEKDWTMRDGLPEAVWAAARLGDHGSYALLMDLRFTGRMDFWIAERSSSGNEPHVYEALRKIDSCVRVQDGNSDGYIIPQCWETAGREKVKMLTYPIDSWSGYNVVGMPDE